MGLLPPHIVPVTQKLNRGLQPSREELGRYFQTIAPGMDFLELLPFTLQLGGRPMDVAVRRPMFAPLFRKKRRSRREIFKCGRQVGKTSNAAGSMMMNLVWRKNFRILYVAPLAIYTNRLHHIHFSNMIRSCGLPWPIQDQDCVNNVNEKTFRTGSHFHGVSCFNSAGNALGIAIDWIVLDEVQDLNLDFVPQIRETLRTSDFRWESYFGTARGIENTIQLLYDESSGGEWRMRCGCKAFGRDIIPDLEHDAIGMIQRHGVACPDCSRLIDVERGEWIHRHPDRAQDEYGEDERGNPVIVKAGFAGFHIPATIVRDVCTPYDRYLETIYDKLHGVSRYSEAKFLQEVLGISSDQGGRPITPEEIQKASVLDITEDGEGFNAEHYSLLAGGQDWGGSEITSFTVGTIVGWHPTGVFHCLGAARPTGIPDNERHIPMAAFYQRVGKGRMVGIGADAGFVGSVQNRNLARISGIRTANIAYGTKRDFFHAMPGNNFVVDRTTLIYLAYTLIREGKLLFPKGRWFETFTKDLTATYIEDVEAPNGITIRRYCRRKNLPDDFLHSLGYALFIASIAQGIDLPAMLGLGANGSLSSQAISLQQLGEEGSQTLDFFGFTDS